MPVEQEDASMTSKSNASLDLGEPSSTQLQDTPQSQETNDGTPESITATDRNGSVLSSEPAAGRPPPDPETQQRLAEELKLEGNQLFGQGQFVDAAHKYNAAIDAAPPDSKSRAIYFCNLAACNIKLKEYHAAAHNASAALAADECYVKALMRRCEALERLDDLDHALADARRVLELDPGSAWAAGTVKRLEPLVAERTEKLKNEMLGKLKELGNSVLSRFGMSLDNFKMEQDPNTGSYSIKFQ